MKKSCRVCGSEDSQYAWYPKGAVNPRSKTCFAYITRKGFARRRWEIRLCMECAIKIIKGEDVSFSYYGVKYNLIGNEIVKEVK